MISSDKFCSPVSILWGGASASVHRQSGRCTTVVHRDRYPQCFPLAMCVLQHIDKVVDVGDAVALWRLVKEFHMFSTCCSRCSPGIWTLFPRAPCSDSHLRVARAVRLESGHYFLEPLALTATCPCALRQSTVAFGRISSIFYVKRGLGSPCSSHLVSGCVSLRCFWKNFTYFHRVGCPGFPAQFALENLDIISTCSHMAVGWVLTHFSRSSGLSRS